MEKARPQPAQEGKQKNAKSSTKPAVEDAPMRHDQRTEGENGESAVLAKIAALPKSYRAMGERLHAIIMASAPTLSPKVWYGMPGYAKEGKVVCFFRGGEKFKERYMTLGFNDVANLDEGTMWPIAYALTELTPNEEEKIATLVKKAVG